MVKDVQARPWAFVVLLIGDSVLDYLACVSPEEFESARHGTAENCRWRFLAQGDSWFAPTSAYRKLNKQQQQSVVATLASDNNLDDLRIALGSLAGFYPECPLTFLFEGGVPTCNSAIDLLRLKKILAGLFDKTTKSGILMQANAVYIAFLTEMLHVSPETSLAKFPAVADYPDTDLSQRVGAAVRTSIVGFFGTSYDKSEPWPGYFWNRGLEIDPCSFGDMEEHD